MKLQFNDGRQIDIENISVKNASMSIKILRTNHEAMKVLFSDEFACERLIVEGDVYEGFIILDQIIDHTGEIWEVIMLQAGSPEDKKVQEAAVKLARIQAKALEDDDANEVKYLFDVWSGEGVSYDVGDRVLYADTLYRVIQAHTSQPDWTPSAAVSLFVRCDNPGEEWPEWIQPTGAHDAYEKGYKVSHSGKHWISEISANTYEPGVYGWTEAE